MLSVAIPPAQKKFCYVNSKGARKKLVAALFNVPRQALDLLPMYARLVAILDKVCGLQGAGGIFPRCRANVRMLRLCYC